MNSRWEFERREGKSEWNPRFSRETDSLTQTEEGERVNSSCPDIERKTWLRLIQLRSLPSRTLSQGSLYHFTYPYTHAVANHSLLCKGSLSEYVSQCLVVWCPFSSLHSMVHSCMWTIGVYCAKRHVLSLFRVSHGVVVSLDTTAFPQWSFILSLSTHAT
jgi:hypothetical protein